jgi:crotonobetainyl-CoA:carnitine CoA-transferase CaiB-like acyl-CoA transferase
VSGPLSDLRVIEYCDELGQLAGKLLSDMGADVIKVEPPDGSSARRVGPFVHDRPGPNRSLNFWYYNTNKRSVVLDLANSESDRGLFRQLTATADVVLESQQPGYLSSLGLGYDQLRQVRRDLVMMSITPFGQDGPWAHFKYSDLVSLALGGPMAMNGYDPEDAPGAPPIHGNGDQAYNTACHVALHGLLAAVYHRDLTGEGQYVDASMHEALSCTVEVGMPYWLYMRQNVIRQTGRHAAAQRTEKWIYPAADGKDVLLFGVGRDNASWNRIKSWLQRHGFGQQFDEERFNDPMARQPARGTQEAKEIMAAMKAFIAESASDDVYRGGQEREQSWGVVRTPDEAFADQHWHDRGFYVTVTGEGIDEPVAMPGAPYIFSATPWQLRRPAPKLGEHTEEVLAGLR